MNKLERCSAKHATDGFEAEADMLFTGADQITTEYQKLQKQ